jgi:type I restriction enzyme R subunit
VRRQSSRPADHETDGRVGVFWHTLARKKPFHGVLAALLRQVLDSPTIVVITDRNDLDDQLYGSLRLPNILRQEPSTESREH